MFIKHKSGYKGPTFFFLNHSSLSSEEIVISIKYPFFVSPLVLPTKKRLW